GPRVSLARWFDALARMWPGEGPAARPGPRRSGRALRPLVQALQEPGNAVPREARRRRCAPVPNVRREAVAEGHLEADALPRPAPHSRDTHAPRGRRRPSRAAD